MDKNHNNLTYNTIGKLDYKKTFEIQAIIAALEAASYSFSEQSKRTSNAVNIAGNYLKEALLEENNVYEKLSEAICAIKPLTAENNSIGMLIEKISSIRASISSEQGITAQELLSLKDIAAERMR